jgi:hypothetical protein
MAVDDREIMLIWQAGRDRGQDVQPGELVVGGLQRPLAGRRAAGRREWRDEVTKPAVIRSCSRQNQAAAPAPRACPR